jgi:hypothetical protein
MPVPAGSAIEERTGTHPVGLLDGRAGDVLSEIEVSAKPSEDRGRGFHEEERVCPLHEQAGQDSGVPLCKIIAFGFGDTVKSGKGFLPETNLILVKTHGNSFCRLSRSGCGWEGNVVLAKVITVNQIKLLLLFHNHFPSKGICAEKR